MIHKFLVAAAAMLACTTGFLNSLHATEMIRVAMRSSRLSVSQPEISVGDVCKIQGSSSQLRQQISELDLDVASVGQPIVVSKQQIDVRIALAGFASHAIRVSGPDSVEINFVPDENLQHRLERNIKSELSSQFGIPSEDIRIRLLDSNSIASVREAIDTTNFKTMVFFPSQLPLGEKSIQVEMTDTVGNRLIQKFKAQIVVLRDVFVTTGTVAKGSIISQKHVQKIKRPLIGNTVDLAGAECLGCTASRDIPPHEVLTNRYLKKRAVAKPAGVKRNDLVDIILTQGPLTVRVKNAKVMTNGAVGQTVRVLNTNSNSQINAVVLNQTTVTVKN